MNNFPSPDEQQSKIQDLEALDQERYELLQHLEDWLETPMVILAFVWLALLIEELVWGAQRSLEILGTVIWIIFILDFALKFTLAPHKLIYIKQNWLTIISLIVPALRVFRIFRAIRLLQIARVGRGLRLVRVISSLNRGMRALAANLHRRGFVYVAMLSLLVLFAGAAGMYTFENQVAGGLKSYGDALWWTAMVLTTMGSQYWPQTFEGRILCFILALYAFAVFGYVTATLATFFVGRDAENSEAEIAGSQEIGELRAEINSLRSEIQELLQKP